MAAPLPSGLHRTLASCNPIGQFRKSFLCILKVFCLAMLEFRVLQSNLKDIYKLQDKRNSFEIMFNTLSCQEVQLRFAFQRQQRKPMTTSIGENVGRGEPLYTAGGKTRRCNHYGDHCAGAQNKSKTTCNGLAQAAKGTEVSSTQVLAHPCLIRHHCQDTQPARCPSQS